MGRSMNGLSTVQWCLACLLVAGAGILRAATPPTAPASRPAEEEIVSAAERNDLPRVKAMLDQSRQLANAADESELRPLHWAASNGSVEMVQLLLDRGADVNARSRFLMPYFGGYDTFYNGQQTPLLLAAARGHTAVARLLLEHGAQVDVQNQFGATPLDLAAAGGNAELMELLLARHAQLDPTTRPIRPQDALMGMGGRRWSVLHLAAESGSPAAIKLLLAQKQSPTTRDVEQQTPLHALVSFSDVGQRLASKGWTYMGSPPLDVGASKQKLARGDRLAALRLLVEAGADVNATDGAGHTPLYYARKAAPGSELEKVLVEKGAQLSIWDASILGDTARVEQILKQSPQALDQPDPQRRTPLLLVVAERAWPMAKFLLEHGAKVDSGVMGQVITYNPGGFDLVLEYRKQFGNGTYGWAICYSLTQGRDDMAAKLLEKRGDLDMTHSSAPLERVVETPERIGMVRQLLAAGVPVDDGGPIAQQPLWAATARGNDVAIRELLAASPGVFKKRGGEYNGLLLQCIWSHNSERWSGPPKALKVLVEAGLDVNVRDSLGLTPLHAAVLRSAPESVELLLSHGADVHAKTKDGKTAFDLLDENPRHEGDVRQKMERLLRSASTQEK